MLWGIASGGIVAQSTPYHPVINYSVVSRLIKENSIGSCTSDIKVVSGCDIKHTRFDYLFTICKPSVAELEQYRSVPPIYTMANADLALGRVKGSPKALTWVTSDENNWQLPATHPRNANKSLCVECSQKAAEQPSIFYESYIRNPHAFYVLTARSAVVLGSGIIVKQCGYYQSHEGCETIFKFIGRKWFQSCHNSVLSLYGKSAWSSSSSGGVWSGRNESVYQLLAACRGRGEIEPFSTPVKKQNKVFVITSQWDTNYHHFLVDSLTKLIRHLDFLKANPDIKIHIRQSDQYIKRKLHIAEAGRKLRKSLFQFLGLNINRVISGMVWADEVYVPRATRCNAPMALALDLRLLVRYFFKKSFPEASVLLTRNPEAPLWGPGGVVETAAERNITLARERRKKNIIIQRRPCFDDYSCQRASWRDWNNATTDAIYAAVATLFPNHHVFVLSAHDSYWASCLACQVRAYANTDLVIGMHGAGMTNMIFMPPHSMVFEIAGLFDGRMTPLCGYHGPLAASFGVHHYLYYYDWKLASIEMPDRIGDGVLYNVSDIANETRHFYDSITALTRGRSTTSSV